jgi:cellulose synthase operon protein C
LPAPKSKNNNPPLSLRLDEDETSFADLDADDLPALKKEATVRASENKAARSPAKPSAPTVSAKIGRSVEKKPARERTSSEVDFSDVFADIDLDDVEALNDKDEIDFNTPERKVASSTKSDEGLRDLPMLKTDGRAASARPHGAEADLGEVDLPKLQLPETRSEPPTLNEELDLPQIKRPSGFDDQFGSLDLPTPKAAPGRPPVSKSGTVQGSAGTSTPTSKGATGPDEEFVSFEDISILDDIDSEKSPHDPSARSARREAPETPDMENAPTASRFSATSVGDDQPHDARDPLESTPRLGDAPSDVFDIDQGDLESIATGSSPDLATPRAEQSDSLIGEELDWGAVAESPPKKDEVKDTLGRTGIGGASYGEVDLGVDTTNGIGSGLGDELEFGLPDLEAFDQDGLKKAAIALPPDVLRRQRGVAFAAKREAYARKTLRLAIRIAVVLLVIAAAGAALGLTEYGFYGMYFLERYLPSAGTPAAAEKAIRSAESMAKSDTYADVRQSLAILGKARAQAGLNRPLLTRSLVHESLFLVRFGQNSASSTRAAAIVARLEERRWKAPGIELALAADALRRDALADAERYLQDARGKTGADVYLELVEGELALRQNKLDHAKQAFENALKLGGGARAQWGITRVTILQRGDVDTQMAAIDETLKLSPQHADAHVAAARILIAQGKEAGAQRLLQQAVGVEPFEGKFLWTSQLTKAAGYSALGYLYESKGRLPKARIAYDLALSVDPYWVEALLGAGRVALREQRYNDALARFESALNTTKTNDPIVFSGRKASVDAELGIGRSYLMLKRAPQAREKIETLVAKFPNDSEIILWLGKVFRALGKDDVAEKDFRRSIELRPDEFEGYLELSQLFFSLKKPEEASIILNQAATKVAESSEMRRMLGQSEIARNRLDNAIHEFKRAIEIDPEDLDARFGLGVAFRRNGQLKEAQNIFTQIEKRDPTYVGLALEHGQLFETQGDYKKAIESYTAALKRDPGNTNLMLRLGTAQVESNDLQAATETLNTVIQLIPNSAEAEHLIGRIAFAKGRSPEALTHFDRAVKLDPTRAEFHLYAGRAALEMSNLGRTLEEAQAAIDRDPSVGDAYWLRGVVRLKTGAVQDALEDLKHALTLSPKRIEAMAAVGDCYDELRNLGEAVAAYKKALEFDSNNGYYWYRFGVLEVDSNHPSDAIQALKRAIAIGDEKAPMSVWLPDAYLQAGNSLRLSGNRESAISHYKRYLEITGPGAIDRQEVEKNLERWGIRLDNK